jgi:hypothetical protein
VLLVFFNLCWKLPVRSIFSALWIESIIFIIGLTKFFLKEHRLKIGNSI